MKTTRNTIRADGPTDADLPELFRALDRLADRIFDREYTPNL